MPQAGITPDSWLYGLDNFLKELRLLVTFDAAAKAGLLDDISGERLAEARDMVKENKHEYGLVAMKAYKAALERAIDVLDEAILSGWDIDEVLSKFKDSLLTRQELVDTILEEMPEEIRTEIEEIVTGTIGDLEVTIIVTDLEADEEDEVNIGEESDNDGEQSAEETEQEDDDTVMEDDASNEDADTEEDSEDTETETEESSDEDDTDTKEEDEDESDAEEDKQLLLPLKKLVTVGVLTDKLGEDAAKLYALGELNLRQLLVVSSLAEQTDKSFEEVLDIFLENGRGIGVTAKALQLEPRAALKGIKEVFKGIKRDIKAAFAMARQDLKAGENLNDEEDTVSTDDDQEDIKDPEDSDVKDDDQDDVDDLEAGEEKDDAGEDDKNNAGRDDEDEYGQDKGDGGEDNQDKDNDDPEAKDKDDEKSSDDDEEKDNKKNNKRKNNSGKKNNSNKADKKNKGNKSNKGNNKNKKITWSRGNDRCKGINWNKIVNLSKGNNGKNHKKNNCKNLSSWYKKYEKGK
ncbi:MAG: DUF5667 domain-containing protein [Caldicoprobacterales bacterium]|nr:hypothetical protein [Clostridiales bacterium]